jgi:hypothetical protein
MIDLFSTRLQKKSNRLLFMGFAFLMAILYDILLWNHIHGIGFVLFVLVYLITFLSLVSMVNRIKQKWPLLFLVPISLLTISVAIFNNELVYKAIPSFIVVLLIIFSMLITLEIPQGYKFYFSQIPLLNKISSPIFKYISIMSRDVSIIKKKNNSDWLKKVLIGVLISVPLFIIFMSLFASADMIFADYLERLIDFEINITNIWRLSRTILIFVLTGGFFYAILSKENILGKAKIVVEKMDQTIVNTVLILLNILFLVFVFIQIKYLFGSYDYVINNEMIFSDYARKGFFQLVWAVIFAAIIFIVIFRSFAHHGMSKLLRSMHVLFVVQTGVIALSALKRMNIYQEAYGYTVLRLYVEWFIYMIIALLVIAVLSVALKWSLRTLLYSGMVVGLLALVCVVFANVDYTIAKRNINRYVYEEKTLDINYLAGLSVDALPALEYLQASGVKERLTIDEKNHINNMLMNSQKKTDSFLEYNLGMVKAESAYLSTKNFLSN